MFSLRHYQSDAIQRVREMISRGVLRLLLVLATGGGKTVVAAHIVASAILCGSRVLFVAHRRELIKQCFCKLVRNGVDPLKVGIVMAGVGVTRSPALDPAIHLALKDDDLWALFARRRPVAPVQVASIQTLANRPAPPADLVILDEAHRSLSKGFTDLVANYPTSVVLGLTATPYRADNRGLGELYEDLVVVASPQHLIDDGFLVEPMVKSVHVSEMPDLSHVKMKGSDYNQDQLADALDNVKLVGNIVEHWFRFADHRRTVVFACNVAHSKHLAARFVEGGARAEHLDGETPTPEREAILARLDSGITEVVVNCGVLCEGWDQPSVKVCILARPTKSTGLYLQMAGRILRPWNDTGALILDHAGCVIEHGFPQDEREFSLESRRKSPGGGARAKVCPMCQSAVPLGTKSCPECSHEFVNAEAEQKALMEEAEGQLVDVRPASRQEKREVWDRLCAEAVANNHKQGWVRSQYVDLFSSPPPADWKAPDTRAANAEHVAQFDLMVREAHAKGHKLGAAKYRFKESIGNWPSNKVMSSCSLATEQGGLEQLAAALDARAEEVQAERELAKFAARQPTVTAPIVQWQV